MYDDASAKMMGLEEVKRMLREGLAKKLQGLKAGDSVSITVGESDGGKDEDAPMEGSPEEEAEETPGEAKAEGDEMETKDEAPPEEPLSAEDDMKKKVLARLLTMKAQRK